MQKNLSAQILNKFHKNCTRKIFFVQCPEKLEGTLALIFNMGNGYMVTVRGNMDTDHITRLIGVLIAPMT